MARVLSALVLLPVVIGTVWFLPPVGTLLLALVAAVLAYAEYAAIAKALGARVLGGSGAAVVLACVAVRGGGADTVLMSALIVIGAVAVSTGRPGPGILADTAASLFAPVYIGLPLGALAAVRAQPNGREAALLLMAVIVFSDSAQYYTGRAFGRHALAPSTSPKKTVEGAIGGVAFGTLAMAVGGRWVFQSPPSPVWALALLGAVISLLGIVGDLFESLLKRSAGVKDSSHLIPGHGGVLDRIDSWLFAAPVYYVFVRWIT
jgi:phosphatidate cytidylyltransferase